MLREGYGLQLSQGAANRYLGGVFNRIFIVPFQTGIWTNMYSAEHGLLGISNIRPLTLLVGSKFVNLPNVVGITYTSSGLASVSCNTSFIFDYQASFGIFVGWCLSGFLLASLDFFILAFRGLNGGLLVACVAAFLASALSLLSSAFTTCLVTHGIAIVALLSMLFRHFWHSEFIHRCCQGCFFFGLFTDASQMKRARA